jgi:calcium-dependent protein kinase
MYRVSGRFGFKRDMHLDYLESGRILGKGSRGVVSVVTSRSNGVEFACKTMLKTSHPVWKEVSALQAMAGNPLVAQLHDVYENDSYVHMVMELCEGKTLEETVPESEDAVREHMRTVLRVLAAVHDKGMVHRDIKPGNFVRVRIDGNAVKAIDFGLAECVPVPDSTPMGTLWYMAPETFSGQTTQKSDLWSAGVMAVELLTGSLPFDDHANRRAPAVREVVKSIMLDRLNFLSGDDSLDDFVRSLLNRDVKARPSAERALEHDWFKR